MKVIFLCKNTQHVTKKRDEIFLETVTKYTTCQRIKGQMLQENNAQTSCVVNRTSDVLNAKVFLYHAQLLVNSRV
jgi:hypothetical protein